MKHFSLPKDGGLREEELPKGILHSYEKIPTEIFDEAVTASEKIADIIAKAISDHRKAGLRDFQARILIRKHSEDPFPDSCRKV